MSDIKTNASKSLIWSFFEKVSVQGVSFLINLFLSRILLPEDYGIVALLAILISISQVFIDSGFSNALIQKQDRTIEDYSTVFFINIIVSIACYALLFVFSDYLGFFFHQPLLAQITPIYALVLILGSLTIVQRTRFYIKYEFRTIAIVSLISVLVGGVCSIFMAYKGYGVWAIVYYYLVVDILRTIGFWLVSDWHPLFCFSKKSFTSVFHFGANLLGANLINVISSNLYTFVIGKFYNAVSLGFYSRGQSIANVIPSNVSNVLTQACYPVLCELQKEKERLKSVFSQYIKMSFMLCAPIMTILASVATPLVSLLLTDKWLPSVYFIQVLAIGYAFDPVMRLNSIVINVTGKSKYSLYAEILKKITLCLLLIVSCTISVKAIALSLAFYSLFDMIIVCFFVNRVVGVSFWGEIKLLLPYILFCLLTSGTICLVMSVLDTNISKLILGTLIGVCVYFLLISLYSKSELMEIKQMIKLQF